MSNSGEPAELISAPSSVPLPGIALGAVIDGKYRVERVVGRGGMGLVVAATHLQLERTVAIKLIREEYIEDPLIVERLVREARAAASIQNEHVARVLDVGTLQNGAPFIVMEYLEGQDLDSLLHSDGPLQVSEAVDFLLQACEAIAEAHFNHIVHRDLKPANLFVAHQPGGGRCVKVVDFGISKLMYLGAGESITDPSRIMGSLYHMAPEQISGDPVDARTDVWALGVLLFEMLTGRKPFRLGAWPAVCNQIVSESAPDLAGLDDTVPEELRHAIRRCLRRAPAERYPNVAELAVELLPFGSRRARHSLERIVRLATATGSLSAEMLFPDTPRLTLRESGLLPTERSPQRSPDVAPGGVASRVAPAQRRPRPLWALGLVLGCAMVVLLGAYLSGGERQPVAAQELAQLSPVADPPGPRERPVAAPELPPPLEEPPSGSERPEPVVKIYVETPTTTSASKDESKAAPLAGPRETQSREPGPREEAPSEAVARVTPPNEAGPREAGPRETGAQDTEPRPTAPRDTAPRAPEPRAPEPRATEPRATEPRATEPATSDSSKAEPREPTPTVPPSRPDTAARPPGGTPWNLHDVAEHYR